MPMAFEFPNPKSPPSPMDKLAMGPDCARHPLLGCIIANNGTPPGDQARNYLLSLYEATVHKVAGRAGDLSEDEFRTKLRELEEWEKTNSVQMPAPSVPRSVMAMWNEIKKESSK
jgi:hypothetical protein